MFCIGCGSGLPNEAQFCPRCGKCRILTQEDGCSESSGTPERAGTGIVGWLQDLTAAPADQSSVTPDPKQTEQSGPSVALFSGESGTQGDTTQEEALAKPTLENLKVTRRFANVGSITLAVIALFCMVIGAVQGFIPIFLLEGVAFGGLAWLCAVRWPVSAAVRGAVLVASLMLAVLVGVTLDQDSFGPRYRYLSQGSVQYRVDERAGRTDRLGTGGWYTVAYESGAKEIDSLDAILTVNLTKGYWEGVVAGGDICFTVNNSSGYVIDRIIFEVKTQKKDSAEAGKDSSAAVDQEVILKSYGGGLISPGQNSLVCASSPRNLSADETWSYDLKSIYGWKR
jgi:hypothetical protein